MSDQPAWVQAPIFEVDCAPRYWEDASVDGVPDENGSRTPFKSGDDWKIFIDLEAGRVLDWPQGVTLKTYFKVCDAGWYWLCDAQRQRLVQWKGSYVPAEFLDQSDGSTVSDYIVLTIDGDGLIAGWKRPVIDPQRWKSI